MGFIPFYSFIILGIGTLIGIFYIVMLFQASKYEEYVTPLNKKEFPLCEIYGAGFAFMDLIHYSFTTRGERKRRSAVKLVYGEKYSDYYLHVIAAQRFALTIPIVVFGFILYGISQDIAVLFVVLAMAGVCYYYFASLPDEKIKKRSQELLIQFPDVVSKLALLINAGMIMKEAWIKIAETGEGIVYEEMRFTVSEMENGISELDAYFRFANRCVIPEIRKFISTVMQGLVKGNSEFSAMITEQSAEMWKIKQHTVKRQGEKAASKLLIPIMLMFLGIMVMIIVPIFANLGA